MDGFAGFPLHSSTPRGSAFIEFTRGDQTAATIPAAPPKPLPTSTANRQESLAILRGAERVPVKTPELNDADGAGSSAINGVPTGMNAEERSDYFERLNQQSFTAPNSIEDEDDR